MSNESFEFHKGKCAELLAASDVKPRTAKGRSGNHAVPQAGVTLFLLYGRHEDLMPKKEG